MNKTTREANFELEFDRACVVHGAAEIVRARGGAAACDPLLSRLAAGDRREDFGIAICHRDDVPLGMLAVESNPGGMRCRALAMKLAAKLLRDEAHDVSGELIGYAIMRCLSLRIRALDFDTANSMPGVETWLQERGLRPGRHGIWKYPGDPCETVADAPPYGQGDWQVVLYNDEETPMATVEAAIVRAAGIEAAAARLLMMKVHVTGSAAVSRHYFNWRAHQVCEAMRGFFHRHGCDTCVEVQPAPQD